MSIALYAATLIAAAAMAPEDKAALVVVSGLPAPPGAGGVIVREWDRDAPRPEGALVFVDQEGGGVRAFPDAPPEPPPSAYETADEALAAGRATGEALRREGVHGDFAPVIDLADGPLGSRHFRRPELAVAFARGLGDAGVVACAKHFPGLGSTPVSTDDRPQVPGRVREHEVEAFRAAIEAGVPCVMTSNAFYDGARFRASISPETYELLRELGFRGVAITDSLSIVREAPVERWSRQALRAGADLVLYTSPEHARRAVAALVPLAEAGELDAAVTRVLLLRARLRAARGP